MEKSKRLNKVVLTAVLIALNVILERLMALLSTSNHFSISVITVAFCAVYLGVGYTVALSTIGDVLGALITGGFNPLFTLTNAVAGLIMGIALNKRASLVTIPLGVVANKVITTLLMNSLWISILYMGGIKAYPVTVAGRIPQAVIMGVIEIVVIGVIFWDKSPIRQRLDRVIKK